MTEPATSMAVKRPPLRIALLADDEWVSKYVFDIAQWASQHADIELSHLIIARRPPEPGGKPGRLQRWRAAIRRQGLSGWLGASVFSLVRRMESHRLRRHPLHRDHLKRMDVRPYVPESIDIVPVMSSSGLVQRFDEGDVARVKALDLDLVLRCGSCILRGGILGAARLGIVSFHHADNRINRGGPAAFWEVYLRQATTGFTIQRLTEELDGGQVLFRGHVGTERHFLLNQAKLYLVSNAYLKLKLERIAADGRLPEALPDLPYAHPLYKSPGLKQTLRYAAGLVATRTREWLDRRRQVQTRWGVAFTRTDWRGAVLWRAHRIPNPAGHFLADPFVVSRDGMDVCFVEDLDHATGKGSITAYRLDGTQAVPLGLVLDEPFHQSFPYVFEYEGSLYMCPESSASRQIRVYKCLEFPMRWELHTILMEGIHAADTMLFERGGRWWMMTNFDRAGSGDHCAEMSIFSADSPLSRTWTPHPANPVVVDAARGRNAGLLVSKGGHFRVAQRQGFNVYGQAAIIHEIKVLDAERYVEEQVFEVGAHCFDGLVGLHHLHSSGSITVFDFCRREPVGP